MSHRAADGLKRRRAKSERAQPEQRKEGVPNDRGASLLRPVELVEQNLTRERESRELRLRQKGLAVPALS